MIKTLSKNFKARIEKIDLFNLGGSAMLYYLLIFYLAPTLVFLGVASKTMLANYHINYQAMAYLTIGLAFLMLGYMTPWTVKIAQRIPNVLKQDWDFTRAFWVLLAVFLGGLVVKIIDIWAGGYSHVTQNPVFVASSFYSLIGLLNWLGYLALVIAFIGYFQLKKMGDLRYTHWRWLAYGIFAFEICYGLPTCSKFLVIVPIFLYLVVRSYLIKIEYWRITLWLMIIILFLFPFGRFCRKDVTLQNYLTVSDASVKVSGLDSLIGSSFLNRIDQSTIFSKIVESQEPFLHGKSLLNFFVTLGPPRFIWKDKPLSMNAYGNDFGHRMGIVGPSDLKTSIGPTMVGDWYLNFGILGIILGMFWMGILFRLIYEYFIKATKTSLSGVFFYSIIWVQIILGMEDWISPIYAGLIKLSIIMVIVNFFLLKRKSFKVRSYLWP
ncbi:MAG: hypothetical protein V1719_01490 [Patescibacteria group bacterium]